MKRQSTPSSNKGKTPKKSKLNSLFDKLESDNAAFLSAAAAESAAFQLAKSKAAKVHTVTPNKQKNSAPSAKTPSSSIKNVKMDHKELARREDRRRRFLEEQSLANTSTPGAPTLVHARNTMGSTVHGENTSLEKDYLRLTSHPVVADVRPPHVLEQALILVRAKWKEGCSYRHACDQLKSIRQDLTVQHVRTPLTVSVYETHARVAMEVADWAEVRQTLAVLGQLYEELGRNTNDGIESKAIGRQNSSQTTPGTNKKKNKNKNKGSSDHDDLKLMIRPGLESQYEFMAYNLMLAAATSRNVLSHELKECAARGFLQSSNHFISHALAACKAAGSGDYAGLLKLYLNAPRMAPYLLDLLVEKTRPRAWSAILSAYGGPMGVPIDAVTLWLGFEGSKDTREWIEERGGVVLDDGNVDVKASREGLRSFVASSQTAGGVGNSNSGAGA